MNRLFSIHPCLKFLLFSSLLFSACSVPQSKTAIDVTGNWESPEWGSMQLRQTGNTVTGTYTHDSGQLSGTLQGGEIRFRWWEKVAAGQGYDSATPSERGDGYFHLSSDEQSLSGEWKYDGSSGWKGKWTAKRR